MRGSIRAALVATTAFLISLNFHSSAFAQAPKFEFRDKDRVVLLGSTLIEREQRYGYVEAELTAALAGEGKSVTFRNLGWSGDTVWAESRGIFDPPAAGYQRMIEQVLELKPTVIISYYGANEAFAGAAGLDRFLTQYRKLLDDLQPSGARFVLVSPLDHLRFSERHPDPAIYNEKVTLYRDAIEKLAGERSTFFVDLTGPLGVKAPLGSPDQPMAIPSTQMTDTGVHLNAYGYKVIAQVIREALLGPEPVEKIAVNLKQIQDAGRLEKTGVVVQYPRVMFPAEFEAAQTLKLDGLTAGRYTLQISDDTSLTLSHEQWANGAPAYLFDYEQFEKMREAIIDKNMLYFHRWRPQNVTYLFLFRKHEQGNNAKDIPEFDPLIEAKEKEIAKLSQPVSHEISIVSDN
ncbi:MAG TPA: SGNH/GDSL hydrolase family protein [Planctomycetaceae bacterium]|nr:SGNH/GDSL hydrolase family protein [Planctomycetaceae bacterium]